MKRRNIETFEAIWSGITLKITFERHWLANTRCHTSHFEIESVAPAREPLPITDTGYKSHFTSPSLVDDIGGPVAYVLALLDADARGPAWQKSRQLSLF